MNHDPEINTMDGDGDDVVYNLLPDFSVMRQRDYWRDMDSASHVQILRVAKNNDILVDRMQCSRCDRIPVPPRVAICAEGHLMCAPCIRRLGPSARCQKEMPLSTPSSVREVRECGESIRRYKSRIFDYLYYNSWFKCVNVAFGCKKINIGSKVKKHEMDCPYRPSLQCPFSSCQSGLVARPAFIQHLITTHGVVSFKSDSSRVQVLDDPKNNSIPRETSNYRWLCALINCFDMTFMLMAEENNDSVNIWISLASDESLVKGRKFQCTLAFVPEKKSSSKGLSWEGGVYPFEKSFDDIVAKEDSLLITRASLTRKYIFRAGDLSIWNIDVVIKELSILSATNQTVAVGKQNGTLAIPHRGISPKGIKQKRVKQPGTSTSRQDSSKLAKLKLGGSQFVESQKQILLKPRTEEKPKPIVPVKCTVENPFLPNMKIAINFTSPNQIPPSFQETMKKQEPGIEEFSKYVSPLPTTTESQGKENKIKIQPTKKPVPRPRTIFPNGRRNLSSTKPAGECSTKSRPWHGLSQRILDNRDKARIRNTTEYLDVAASVNPSLEFTGIDK